MVTERQANEASTTLVSAITAGATTLVVTDATRFPKLPLFRIRVSGALTAGGSGVEYMQVNGVNGTTFTVLRATELPYNVALGFAAGAVIDHVMTAEALLSLHAVDVRTTGAKGDGKELVDGAMSSTTNLSSATAGFVANDVGKVLEVKAAGALAGTPAAVTLTASTTSGTLAAGTYRYIVTAVNDAGQTLPSTAATVVTTGATSRVKVSWAAQNQALRYRIYRSPAGGAAGTERFIMQIGDISWWDDGAWAISGGSTAGVDAVPSSNTMRLYHSTTIATVASATAITLTGAASVAVASGATFTYGTDDTAAIQAALANVPSEGATVLFPGGVYLISAALKPKPMTQMVGEHDTRFSLFRNTASRCKLVALSTWNTGTSPGMFMPGTVAPPEGGSAYAGVQVRGLCFVGNGMGAGMHGIRMQDWATVLSDGEQSWVLEHVTLSGFTGSGLYGTMAVFLFNDVFIQMNSAWGLDSGPNPWNDIRLSNVWITFNESGGVRMGLMDAISSVGGANVFYAVRCERSGNKLPIATNTQYCKDAPGFRIHGLFKTQFVACQTDSNTGSGVEIMAPPSSVLNNAISGLTFTDLQTNRDGGGDQITLPNRAGLYVKGYLSASPNTGTEGANRIKLVNHYNTTGKADDSGAVGIQSPKWGVHVEQAEYLHWVNGHLDAVTASWDANNPGNNYSLAIFDPFNGLVPGMASATIGGGFTTGNMPSGNLSVSGGQFQPVASSSWWGAPVMMGFEYLGSAVLGSAATTVDLSSIQARTELLIWFRIVSLSASDTVRVRFNNDTGSNYWWRGVTSIKTTTSGNAPAFVDTFLASTAGITVYPLAGTAQLSGTILVNNLLATSKLATVESRPGSGAAATVPTMLVAGSGEWVNTSAQITQVTFASVGASATLGVGSGFAVWGRTF